MVNTTPTPALKNNKRAQMTEKRITSIAALIAAIGILLFGIASLIYSLRGPNCTMSPWFSATYTAGSPSPTPMAFSQSFTNRLSPRAHANTFSPKYIAAMLNSLKEAETNLITHSNDFARALANAVATNEQMKAFGVTPEVVSNAIIKTFSRPDFRKRLLNPSNNMYIKQLIEDAAVNGNTGRLTKVQTKIIRLHP